MSHPLHLAPACHPHDLGRPIPDSPHAVSVCLPTWADVIGYEEKEERVLARLRTGYPRFFIHPLVERVCQKLLALHGNRDEACLPFPAAVAAQECAQFVRNRTGMPVRMVAADGGLTAVFFPAAGLEVARQYWQHSGRILSSRSAESWLESGQCETAGAAGEAAANEVVARLASGYGAAPAHVTLHPNGMAAIFRAFELVTAHRPGRRCVMFGFPYIDTLKILAKFGPGVEFFSDGGGPDLDALKALLEREEFAAVFCEIPSNPLLQVVDLPVLRSLTKEAGVPLIVDDTIGTFHNVDVLPWCDLAASSLTKAFSGEGDVMAGALVASPHGCFHSAPPAPGPVPLSGHDALVLERNSRDFAGRMELSNRNATALAQFLAGHPAVKDVYHPSLNDSSGWDRLRKPGGGYGALLSFLPLEAEVRSPAIYEALACSHGISLGTPYTLVCPYVQLAHYRELDWARSCGIDPFLLRVAVGTEETNILLERFRHALDAGGAAGRD